MSARNLRARLDRLGGAPDAPGKPMCVNHGPACAMGTQELPELYRMVIEAKRSCGHEVPPLDEHRLMTAQEREQYERETAELLAEAKARNELALAELLAGGEGLL